MRHGRAAICPRRPKSQMWLRAQLSSSSVLGQVRSPDAVRTTRRSVAAVGERPLRVAALVEAAAHYQGSAGTRDAQQRGQATALARC